MRIAIELDNIVRDNNAQALKYYWKGYDNNFDEDVDLGCSDLLSMLPFKSNKARKEFREIDYPYELFGCAKTTQKNLHVEMEDWMESNEDIEVIYFSLHESALVIQSTYFFLSKGSKVRAMMFPKKAKDIWKHCDVAVTIDKDVVNSKPTDKKVIVVRKSDNKKMQDKADIVYDDLISMLHDADFKTKVNIAKRENIFNKIIRNIKNTIQTWTKRSR